MKKESLKQKKGTKGITLVALVATIVVLLILAGITITMLFSDNGIITKAREAADAVDKAQGDTLNGLNDLADDMGVALGEAPKVKEQGKLVPIETKYAKYTDSTSSDPVYVPGGYGVVKDSSTGEKNTIASGLVISDLEDDTLDNELIDGKRGNQFVWVPVNTEQFNKMYDATNKRGNLYNFTTTGTTPITYSVTGNREPDIVTKDWNNNIDDYDTNATYLNIITDFTVEEGQTKTANLFKAYLQKEFDSMIASVEKYKGFYIGRYETSEISTTDKTVKPTIQKGGTVEEGDWYYMYQESKNIAKENENITSSMIWGCQWDRILEWIAQTNLKDGQPDYSLLTNSKTWGNYSDSEGDAAANSGGSVKPSGTNPAWQKNHIYDLAGNAIEWTVEASFTDRRIIRGGSYYYSGSGLPASNRHISYPSGTNSQHCASRAALYVK